MGWKTLKAQYKITHDVHVTEQGICIGSGFIPDIVIISLDGRILKRWTSARPPEWVYQMDADPEALRAAVEAIDQFETCLTVYTYKGDMIIEKQCEALGYPNVTHDGYLQYENMFSADKSKVIGWAKRNAEAGIEIFQRHLTELAEKVKDYQGRLDSEVRALKSLEGQFPGIGTTNSQKELVR